MYIAKLKWNIIYGVVAHRITFHAGRERRAAPLYFFNIFFYFFFLLNRVYSRETLRTQQSFVYNVIITIFDWHAIRAKLYIFSRTGIFAHEMCFCLLFPGIGLNENTLFFFFFLSLPNKYSINTIHVFRLLNTNSIYSKYSQQFAKSILNIRTIQF